MTQRTKAIQVLQDYFEAQGGVLSHDEYRKRSDTPIRFMRIRQIFGSWNRMENIVRKANARNEKPVDFVPLTDIDEVIARRDEERRFAEEQIRAASEDVDAKTLREEAARAHAEADALRAASVEGVLENKMRKGGVTDVDAKTKKEALEQAVAEEHAMLARTAAGAALGKELLGGVEDNDEKTRVIAEQNAFREKKALLAATPQGAAQAVLMEDDTDGQLSREAQSRLANEQRIYVPPVTEASVDKAKADAVKVVRDEIRDVIEDVASDENLNTGAATIATEARAAARVEDTVELTEELIEKMPPADRPVDHDFVASQLEESEGIGKVERREPVKTVPAKTGKTTSATAPKATPVKTVTVSSPGNTNTKSEAKDN